MKKYFAILIVCILALNFVLISGCLTAKSDISRSKSIMNDANKKIEKIDFKNDSYSILKDKTHEIKIDYQSALSILLNAKTIDDNEMVEIEYLTKKLNYNIQILDYLLSYEDLTVHIQNSSRNLDSNEYSLAHSDISLARQDLTDAISFSKQAKTTINSIDSNSIALEDKGKFYRCVNFPYLTEPDNDFSIILDILDSRIDAIDFLDQANIYLKSNDFDKAKPYLIAAKARFENVKEKSNRLINSQNYETYEMAGNISDSATKQITDIDQVLSIIPPSYAPINPLSFRILLPQLGDPLALL
ncbi:MAG: hypothetical protein M0Q91_07945 [Methanoregula sp.]|jgi:tetratricopeptide (TPR) repeat protein|nr:hypothetical protein [Methanoregula sp.]